MTITFNPGPSHVSEQTLADVSDIAASGLLSTSHRTDCFREIVRSAVGGMRRAMRIPDDYLVVFQPSATAGMELVLRNCVSRTSFHFVSGAFAKRFADTADQIGLSGGRALAEGNAAHDWQGAVPPRGTELIALTHTETSTGQMWPADALAGAREKWAEPLIAVDATSSFGAVEMSWTDADLWFGSVQKCLGLPAGLGFVLAGPRARNRAEELGSGRHVAGWQDLLVLEEKMANGDTFETPNMLAIALLERQMKRWDSDSISASTREKGALVAGFEARPFVEPAAWRSETVHNLVVEDPAALHARAEAAGFVLGKGYGPLRDSCIRIATFPAHRTDDVRALLEAMRA